MTNLHSTTYDGTALGNWPTQNFDILNLGILLCGWAAGRYACGTETLAAIPLSAYMLWLWHLHWFTAYRLPDLNAVTHRDIWYIIARFVSVVGFVALTSHGLATLLRRHTPDWLESFAGREGYR